MCFSSTPKAPATTVPSYVHNPYLDGGAYGNTVDSNRVGTSALTIGLNPVMSLGNHVGISDPNQPQFQAPGPSATTPSTPNPGAAGGGNGGGNGGGGVRGINR